VTADHDERLEDLNVSGVPLLLSPDVITAFAMVTLAAARASVDCGAVLTEIPAGIERASREIIDGKRQSPLRLDLFQGGAGTALRVGMALGNRRLVVALHDLIVSFRAKGQEFDSIHTTGRIPFPDAAPTTLGQEFTALGMTVAADVHALEVVQHALCEISVDATAIGTSLNAPLGYAQRCTAHLADVSGLPLSLTFDPVEAAADPVVLYSSSLKCLAVTLSTVCHDLRLLAAASRTGQHAIALPLKRPASSIVPRTMNPKKTAVATMARPTPLNVVEPAVAACIFEAQTLFINAVHVLRLQCVDGITANPGVRRHDADSMLRAYALATFPGLDCHTGTAPAPTAGGGATSPEPPDWLFMQPWPRCSA
jgi:aspartate ammonia-lyase